MTEEKREEKVEEVNRLTVELQDLIVESYTKAFMAYRISLENWFILNELLAHTEGKKLHPKEVQERLNRLFSVINNEILKEFVRFNNLAQKRMQETIQTTEKDEEEKKEKEEE